MSTALVPITGTSVTTVTANVFVYDKKADQWVSITPIYTGTVAPPPAGGGGGGTTGPHTHVIADILDWPAFDAIAFSGEWSDIRSKPTFTAVATSGEYKDLLNAPVLAPVAKTGLWSDLTGAPVLSTIATSGKYTDLTGAPVLATVATTGSYNDLKDKPTIPIVPVKGILAGTNVTVTELNGVFTINSAGGGGTGTLTQVNSDWSATTGVAKILNKPVIPAKVSELLNDSLFVNSASARASAPIQSLTAGANVVLTNDGAGNFTIAAAATGGGGGGGVTLVSGSPPLTVINGGTTPVISIANASESTPGASRFSTAAEAKAGILDNVGVSPLHLHAEIQAAFTAFAAGDLKTALAAKSGTTHTHTVSQITDFPTFAKVAKTGAYADITGTPTLSKVATSGAYTDLTGTPTLPTKVSDLTNDSLFVNKAGAAAAAPVQTMTAGAHITITDDGAGNFTIASDQAHTGGGGTGGGGVTNVTASAPLKVMNGSTTPAISIADATVTSKGVVTLASANDVSAGTAGHVVDAAELKTELAKHAMKSHHHTKADITDFPTLATVATSGSFTDLKDKPTIPAAQVSADWTAASGVAQILHKPTIPTKVSELANDSAFVNTAQAKAAAPIQSVVGGTNVTVTNTNGTVTVNANLPAAAGAVKADWTAAAGTAAEILHKPALKPVATTGAYADLTGKPTIPPAQVQSDWNATTGMGVVLNKPTIPAAQVSADWTATSGVAQILHKPTFATVATSGSYNDLKDKPTIPTSAGTGGGVTSVTGTAPISVTGTTTPVIAVAGATTTQTGVVRYATPTEVTNGTAATVVDAATLKKTYAALAHTHVIHSKGSPAKPVPDMLLADSSGTSVSGSGLYGYVAPGNTSYHVGLCSASTQMHVESGAWKAQTGKGTDFATIAGSSTGTVEISASTGISLTTTGTVTIKADKWPTVDGTAGQVLTMGASNQMKWTTPAAGGSTTIPMTTITGISIPSDKHPGSGIYARTVLGDSTNAQVGMASGKTKVDLQPSRAELRSGAATLTGTGVSPGLGINGTTGNVSLEGAGVVINCSATGSVQIGGYHWPSISTAPKNDEYFLTSDSIGVTSFAPVTKVKLGGSVTEPGIATVAHTDTGFFGIPTGGIGFARRGIDAGGLSATGGWMLSSGETKTNAYVSVNEKGVEIRSNIGGNPDPSVKLKLNADAWPTNKVRGTRFDTLQYDEHNTLNWQPMTIYDRKHPNQPGVQLDVLFELASIISKSGWAGLKAKIAAS